MIRIKQFLIYFAIILQFLTALSTGEYVCAVDNKNLTSAESMITIEAKTGRVLYSKNEHKKLPMASTTKILTAIVAIESVEDLDLVYEVPKEAVGIEGSSIYLKVGEHLSIRELLYGLMLRSGNDAAVAIAILVAGSVDKFVKNMNEFCDELGLKNTNIVTVSGLHHDDHYTTASDLAKITARAFENDIFAEIVRTKNISISNEFDDKNKCRFLKNKNKLLSKVEGADGVKTGYTKKAGRCFVGSALRDGMRIICVLLNCGPMFEDCDRLLEKAFNEFKLVKVFNEGAYSISGNEKTQNNLIIIEKDIYYPLKNDEIVKIYGKLNLGTIKKEEKKEKRSLCKLELYLENNLIFSTKVITINTESINGVEDTLNKILKAF